MESPRAHILFVEDSTVFREMQSLLLEKAGFAVSAHETAQSALTAARTQPFELVVIDYELPDMNGHEFMHQLRAIRPEIAVVFVSGSLTLELAIQLSSEGVAGIFNKPANPKILLEKINETIFRNAARDTAVRGGSASPVGTPNAPAYVPIEPSADQCAYTPQYVLGSGEVFREFTHRLWKVRDFRSVLLLQGEHGSPFELFGRELADISQFRQGPVMACSGTQFEPRTLIETLAPCLLSHDAGTLIVTGVESFSAAQQKTLENLVTGRDVFLPFARRFRLVLAATPELATRVENGEFGETLFYKISALSLTVPTLREMTGDIATNALQILAQLRTELNADTPATLTPEAAAMLEVQPWPRNYAELVEKLRAAVQSSGGPGALGLEAFEYADAGVNRGPCETDTLPPFHSGAGADSTASVPSFFRPASVHYQFADRLRDALNRAGIGGVAA